VVPSSPTTLDLNEALPRSAAPYRHRTQRAAIHSMPQYCLPGVQHPPARARPRSSGRRQTSRQTCVLAPRKGYARRYRVTMMPVGRVEARPNERSGFGSSHPGSVERQASRCVGLRAGCEWVSAQSIHSPESKPLSTRNAAWVPFASARHRADPVAPIDRNAMCSPLGDQVGSAQLMDSGSSNGPPHGIPGIARRCSPLPSLCETYRDWRSSGSTRAENTIWLPTGDHDPEEPVIRLAG
jgi:hypothetical protein